MSLSRFSHTMTMAVALFLTFLLGQILHSEADCPLDFSSSNFTLIASACNNIDNGKCCRYINGFVAVSASRYSNYTGHGVPANLTDVCSSAISETILSYGIPSGLCGSKYLVKYDCEGLTTHSPRFQLLERVCAYPLHCRSCLKAAVNYIRSLGNRVSTSCRTGTFSALASRVDYSSTLELAGCFFNMAELKLSPELEAPEASPRGSRSDDDDLSSPKKSHQHLSVLLTLGFLLFALAIVIVIVLLFRILPYRRLVTSNEGIMLAYSKMRKATKDFN